MTMKTSNLTNEDLGLSDEDISAFMGVEDDPGTAQVDDKPEPTPEVESETVSEASGASGDDDEDELTQLRKQNELLLKRLNEVSQPVAPTVATPENIENNVTEETLFGDWKIDDVMATEENFKSFLSDFAKKIITNTEERLLRQLPGTVAKMTTEQMETREAVTKFYSDNAQLAEVKPFVAKIVSTVAGEHADWDLHQVLAESADRAYKALGLKKQVVEQEKTTGKKPAFASPARGNRGGGDNSGKSKLEKELEELMELE